MEVLVFDRGFSARSILTDLLYSSGGKIKGEFVANCHNCKYSVVFFDDPGPDGSLGVLSGRKSAAAAHALHELDQLIQRDGWQRLQRVDLGDDWYSRRYQHDGHPFPESVTSQNPTRNRGRSALVAAGVVAVVLAVGISVLLYTNLGETPATADGTALRSDPGSSLPQADADNPRMPAGQPQAPPPPAQQLGSPEVRQTGSPEVRQTGSPEVRQTGSPEVRQPGSPEVRQPGSPEVRQPGSPEVRQPTTSAPPAARPGNGDRCSDGPCSQQPQPKLLDGPSFVYPQDGQILDSSESYLLKVNPVVGASGYLFGFFQNDTMVWENYRDEGTLSGTEYGIHPETDAHRSIQPGALQVWVRALVGEKWTEATIIDITIA